MAHLIGLDIGTTGCLDIGTTGCKTLPKLLWIREHEPETWARAARFVLYEDWMIGRLTGQWAISRCLASRTQLYDISRSEWSNTILTTIKLKPEQLSPEKTERRNTEIHGEGREGST